MILKFMTSQTGLQTIAIHISPNISRSKGNQTMKFSHLIEHNMRKTFVKKSYTKYAGETFSDPYLKNQNSLFLLYANLRTIEI